jgi:hypothetical protein
MFNPALESELMTSQKVGASNTITIELNNVANLSYTAPLYFGSPDAQGSELGTFVFDSTSSYLSVTTTGCTTCWNTYYDPSLSETSTPVAETDALNLEYGSSKASGPLYTDKVCLLDDDEKSCASEMEFVAISSESGLAGLDGVLGMAPFQKDNGTSFVQ